MATVYGNIIGSAVRSYITYTVNTNDATTYKITVTEGMELLAGYSRATNNGGSGSASLSGTSQSTYTETIANGWSVSNATSSATTQKAIISSKVYTWAKAHSTQNVTISGSVTPKSWKVTPFGGGTERQYTGTSSVSTTIGIGAKSSYAVTYYNNGGTGAPSAQTKWHGETLTLSTTKPTRTGYSFQGWATSATGGVAYASGATYTGNSALNLYAVWKANTYTIAYNNNGGSGTIANQTKTYGVNLTLSNGAGFTRALHSLTGWNTKANGSGDAYAKSGTYSANASATLYAQWHLDYIKPVISNFTFTRVDSNGDPADDGLYLKVNFSYVGGSVDGMVTYIPPYISVTIDQVEVYNAEQSTGTGTFTQTFGTYTENSSHSVLVKVWDSNLTTGTTATASVPSATYPIDLLADGSAMGIMTTANAGQKVTMPTVYINDDIYIYIDQNAQTGVDAEIYDTLTELGWI